MFRVLVILWCLAVAAPAQRVIQPVLEMNPTTPVSTSAGPDTTALGALALLPKETAGRVARIEGPEGHPFPERWYVLVHEPAFPTGLREFVISEGKPVANRGLSQFADKLSAEDVIGAAAVKINSVEAAGIAAQFTLHNGELLGSIRYELLKLDAAPVWRLTCAAQDGHLLGTLVLHAGSGSVISFDGFAKSPLQTDASVASQSTADVPEEANAEVTSERPTRSASTPAKTSKPRTKSRKQTVTRRKSTPGPIDRVGNFFRKVFH
jgi:hypothetical protein